MGGNGFSYVRCFGGVIGLALLPALTATVLQKKDNTPKEVRSVVINTWAFTNATKAAWDTLMSDGSALDAVEQGCSQCERDQCDGSVGYGNHPDESGETTLDAMIMDGVTHDVGAVGDLRRVKQAISVARAVMMYTTHTMLAGEAATNFAVEMGFTATDLSTNTSMQVFKDWKANNCQPNYRQNVSPDPSRSCGPYTPLNGLIKRQRQSKAISSTNHDTIGMVVIDGAGKIAGGTSTNGASHKVPGRIGDSPIAGSGVYVEQGVGGAAGTGDGDVMMRFLPSFYAVTLMAQGLPPDQAAAKAISRIASFYPSFSGALIAVNMNGDHGAACHGFDTFPYSVCSASTGDVQVFKVACTNSTKDSAG